jgi:hypothetical protein
MNENLEDADLQKKRNENAVTCTHIFAKPK